MRMLCNKVKSSNDFSKEWTDKTRTQIKIRGRNRANGAGYREVAKLVEEGEREETGSEAPMLICVAATEVKEGPSERERPENRLARAHSAARSSHSLGAPPTRALNLNHCSDGQSAGVRCTLQFRASWQLSAMWAPLHASVPDLSSLDLRHSRHSPRQPHCEVLAVKAAGHPSFTRWPIRDLSDSFGIDHTRTPNGTLSSHEIERAVAVPAGCCSAQLWRGTKFVSFRHCVEAAKAASSWDRKELGVIAAGSRDTVP